MIMDKLLSLRTLTRLLDTPAKTILAWVKAGTFPPPIFLPSGVRRWHLCAYSAWVADRTRQAGGDAGRDAELPVDDADEDADTRDDEPDAAAGSDESDEPVNVADLPETAQDIIQVLQEAEEDRLVRREIAKRIGGGVTTDNRDFDRCLQMLRGLRVVNSNRRGIAIGPRPVFREGEYEQEPTSDDDAEAAHESDHTTDHT